MRVRVHNTSRKPMRELRIRLENNALSSFTVTLSEDLSLDSLERTIHFPLPSREESRQHTLNWLPYSLPTSQSTTEGRVRKFMREREKEEEEETEMEAQRAAINEALARASRLHREIVIGILKRSQEVVEAGERVNGGTEQKEDPLQEENVRAEDEAYREYIAVELVVPPQRPFILRVPVLVMNGE